METLHHTANSWRLAFIAAREASDQRTDEPRFMMAFRDLIVDPDLDFWPAPGKILQRLPKRRIVVKPMYPSLSAGEVKQIEALSTSEKHEHAKQACDLVSSIVNGRCLNPGVQPNEKARAEQHRRERSL